MNSPVLFLGLGGTGKDTLMHVRRLFLDAYAAEMPDELRRRYGPTRLPHMTYLGIDADDKMEDIDGRKFDEFTMQAKLSAGEFLNVELDPMKVLDLYTYPERYPEYAHWFDFSLEKTGIPKHGCGQTRPWGRLAFFQHYPRIRQQLRMALTSLTAADVAGDARKVGVENLAPRRVQVFVIFSVAGGTGSGLFLDTAFLLQDLAHELQITVNAEALILLPEVFSDDPTHRVFANAYAALMEIEYYNLLRAGAADLHDGPAQGAEGVFPVYWPGRVPKGETLTLRGPVFEPVWLIGNRSRGVDGQGGTALRPDHKSELAAMMAEWMYLRVSPKLQTLSDDINLRASNYNAEQMIRTERVPVIELGAHDPTGYVELSCRYGAFGAAKLFTPVNVVRQIAGDRLVGDITGRWLETGSAAPTDNELRLEIRPEVLIRIAGQMGINERLHEDALYDYIDGEGAVGGASVVREVVNAFTDEFHPSIAEDAGQDLGKALRDKFHEFQWGKTSVEPQGAGYRGVYSEKLRASADAVFQRVRQGLDAMVGHALKLPQRRFAFAEAALSRLAVEFTDLAARADAHANDVGSLIDQTTEDLDGLLRHAGNSRSNFVLRRIARVAIDYQADHIRLELEAQVWRHVAKGAREIVGLIGSASSEGASMLNELKQLEVDLRAMRQRLAARVTGLETRHESILNMQVIASNPDAYYRDQQGKPIGDDFLQAAEGRLYGDAGVFGQEKDGPEPSPWAFKARFKGSQGDVLLDALAQFGAREMSHVTDKAEDVATLIDHKFSGAGASADYANAIRQSVQSGTAWLGTRALRRDGHWESAVHYSVGRPSANPQSAQALEAVFANSFREAAPHYVDSPRDTIYLYQEVAAFPLTVLPRIRDYRDKAYLRVLQRERSPASEARGGGGGLHIELNIEKYVDLVEPTREEATRRSQAVQLFIEALITGRLTPARDRFGLVHYSFSVKEGLSVQPKPLGRYDRAVRLLMDHQSAAYKDLFKQVEDVKAAWDGREDRGLVDKGRVLAILDRYIREPDNSPVRGEEWTRNAQRLSDALVARWGKEAFDAGHMQRAQMAEWALAAADCPTHITPPNLPPPTW